ncbi:MAG: ParA family protein [Sphingomonadales bacterium]|nr:ParA family protein [Sphingomonadales bacterium]
MKIITVANYKGGTGKTSTTLSLAGLLSQRGRRCLIVDFDPQGQCAIALGLTQEPGAFNALVNTSFDLHQWIRPTGRERLDIIPGDRTTATAQIVINAENRGLEAIRKILNRLKSEYDYIFLDTAPSVGGIQERAVYAADLVLIPTATEFMSSNGLSQIMTTLGQMVKDGWTGKLLGILPTFYDENTTGVKDHPERTERTFQRGHSGASSSRHHFARSSSGRETGVRTRSPAPRHS